ncbi:MAG TPA: beta-galactosidase [Vicinamibacterales bacterium]|nr:beta-galactosidase [Vicinamibacterales bacterium]
MSRNVVIRPALPFLAILLTAVPVILLTGAPVRASNDFGVTIEFYRDADKQAEMMAAAGVGWVRVDLAWSAAEPEAGRYDFRTWDRFLDSFEPHGIRVLFILDYGNRLYEDGLPPSTASGRAGFAAFGGAAARHFRGRAAWEIWNEPNVPRFWAGTPDPAGYVALARAAAAEIRREDPRAWILGPSLGGDTFDFTYLSATFNLGLLDIVDAVSVHPYGAAYPEAAAAFYDEVRRRIALRAPDRDTPVVVSEWGYAVEGLGGETSGVPLARSQHESQVRHPPHDLVQLAGANHSLALLRASRRPWPAEAGIRRHCPAARRNQPSRRSPTREGRRSRPSAAVRRSGASRTRLLRPRRDRKNEAIRPPASVAEPRRHRMTERVRPRLVPSRYTLLHRIRCLPLVGLASEMKCRALMVPEFSGLFMFIRPSRSFEMAAATPNVRGMLAACVHCC